MKQNEQWRTIPQSAIGNILAAMQAQRFQKAATATWQISDNVSLQQQNPITRATKLKI